MRALGRTFDLPAGSLLALDHGVASRRRSPRGQRISPHDRVAWERRGPG
jgi:hypothetical protein